MKLHKIILIALLAVSTVTAAEENETVPQAQQLAEAESWRPIESAKKVGSGLIMNWEVPEDGTVFFAESTKRISFITKSVKKGDVFTTLDEDGDDFDDLLGELIEMSIPDVEEILPTLRFSLYFLPKEQS